MFSQIEFIKKVYPLHRTLVSDDTDLTLEIIRDNLPEKISGNFNIIKIASGTKCWTWTTPKKYDVKNAYIQDEEGNRIVDFHKNNLYLVSYSQPVDCTISFDELEKHLFFSEKIPDAIPWKFYYYKKDWGFCIERNNFNKLDKSKKYHCVIDAEFTDDYLKVGELFIKGKTKDELLIVTNICHPYQVNDSITGVSSVLEMLQDLETENLNYGLRILFLPETIGSICYFSQNEKVAENIKFGIFTEMLGNDNSLVLQKSYEGNTYIDFAAEFIMKEKLNEYRSGNFRELAGNDELVTNGPGLGIPTISITRSAGAFKCYPEYHTSADEPSILIEENLSEAALIIKDLIQFINDDYKPKRKFKGPVFLSGYGLWDIWDGVEFGKEYVDRIMYMIEGEKSVLEISKSLNLDYYFVKHITDSFFEKNLIEKILGLG